MKTYFASPERNSPDELYEKIEVVNNSPLMKVFLNSISGLLAVLDEHRQIVSVNDLYLKTLGISDPESILGLRPGESVHCIHSHEEPGGCGTSRYCRTCGAAVAITVSLTEDKSVERECAISTRKNGRDQDLFLQVRCEPVELENQKFLLLFMYDVTKDQQRKMLERAFFHDFSNIVGGLATANYMLSWGKVSEQVVKSIDTATKMLIREIEVQRCLMNNDLEYYKTAFHYISPPQLFSKLESLFKERAESENKALIFKHSEEVGEIKSDEHLLIRILSNMISNALEATKENCRVLVFSELSENGKKLSVHNGEYIPDEVQLKIFQKNFSTKQGSGRGIGTYSMKLFGEELLEGEVGFTSTPEWGTDFFLKLPDRE